MKQFLGTVVSVFVLVILFMTGSTYANTIVGDYTQILVQLESMIGLDRANIHTALPYEAIYANLEQYCTLQDLEYAQVKREEFLNLNTTKKLFSSDNSIRKQITFDLTKQKILALSTYQDEHNCAKMYFLYQILELLQDPGTTEPVVVLQHNTSSGDTEIFRTLTDYYIQTRLKTLLEDGILDQQDITRLYDALHINYIQTCGSVHGAFHMLVWSDGRREVSKIVLNINTCLDSQYLSNFSNYVDQILVHELGHYIYYFKDFNHADFDAICRTGKRVRCLASDFVSTYAQNSKEEDYAESFAYWYLVEYPNTNSDTTFPSDPVNRIPRTRKTEKLDYFRKLV